MNRYCNSVRYREENNIWNDYRKISSNFCEYYYRLWDQNFPSITNLYSNDAKVNFMSKNVNSVHELLNHVKGQGIWNFDHTSIHGACQLMNEHTILINVYGNICINCIPYHQKYTETLIIRRDIWNRWFITNSIFRIIPDSPF